VNEEGMGKKKETVVGGGIGEDNLLPHFERTCFSSEGRRKFIAAVRDGIDSADRGGGG